MGKQWMVLKGETGQIASLWLEEGHFGCNGIFWQETMRLCFFFDEKSWEEAPGPTGVLSSGKKIAAVVLMQGNACLLKGEWGMAQFPFSQALAQVRLRRNQKQQRSEKATLAKTSQEAQKKEFLAEQKTETPKETGVSVQKEALQKERQVAPPVFEAGPLPPKPVPPMEEGIRYMNPFPELFPSARWEKREYHRGQQMGHYLIGEIYQGRQCIATGLAVPGAYRPSPPGWLRGFGQFCYSRLLQQGYWIKLMWEGQKGGAH